MRHTSFLAVLSIVLLPLQVLADTAVPAAARKLHFDALVVDTHDDTTQRMLNPAFDLGERHTEGSIDIPRMREGGLDAVATIPAQHALYELVSFTPGR